METHEAIKQKKYFWKGAFLIIVIVLLAIAPGFPYLQNRMDLLRYPRHYQDEVEAAAGYFGMEPNFIYAIIKAESGFSETAVSSAGAVGLMQILPDTFLFDIRQHIGLANESSSALFDAKTNIMAGTYYISHWYGYFLDVYRIADPAVEALAAYNAGIGHVWEWLEEDSLSDWDGLFIETIPFEETKQYVEKVLRYKEKYDELYGIGIGKNDMISETVVYRYARTYGEEFRIDPRLVLAVIHAESSFNPRELSPSGAMGLMQITKSTYVDIKGDLHLQEEYEDLFDPEFNVKCGAYYLHWVDERIDGIAQIAASYNMGVSTVQEWLSNPLYSHDGKQLIIENIPIDTTRRYVQNVLKYYEEYCIRYPME